MINTPSKAGNVQEARGLYQALAALAEAHPDEPKLRDMQEKIYKQIHWHEAKK